MRSKSMIRVERAAAAIPDGPAILESVKAARPELIAAAKQGRPPVAGISQMLLDKFGSEVRALRVKQLVGLASRAILEEAGFELTHSGVRIPGDPLFTTGSVYRLRADNQDAQQLDDALERMLMALTPSQASRAFHALLKTFPHLRHEGLGEKPTTPSSKRAIRD
jgi:hypothetical protein